MNKTSTMDTIKARENAGKSHFGIIRDTGETRVIERKSYPANTEAIEKEWMSHKGTRHSPNIKWASGVGIALGSVYEVGGGRFETINLNVRTNLEINLDGETVARLHPRFRDLYNEIERSKYILELEEGWDGEDAIPYQNDTWVKSVKFLVKYYQWIYDTHGEVLSPPKIYHGPNGSIDLLWKTEDYKLLVNISPDSDIANFYGDDYSDTKVEGELDIRGKKNDGFMLAMLHCS